MTQQPVSQSYNGTFGNQNRVSLRFEKLKISEIIEHPQNSVYMNSQQYNMVEGSKAKKTPGKKNKKKSKSGVKGDLAQHNQTFMHSSRSSHFDLQGAANGEAKVLAAMDKTYCKHNGAVLLPVRQSNVNFDKYLRLRSS